VDLSPDIRNCIIYFDTRDNKEKVLATLESKIHHFKDIIAKKMKIKFIPNIKFKIDDIIENSTKINQLLNKISFTSNDS
ncbi:MAG: ribosome-binding factor A, partial [Holosporales bacterium]|nr:ribosome-binding factor A [Holosporales bacterium]